MHKCQSCTSDAFVIIQEFLGESYRLVPVHVEVVSHLSGGAEGAFSLHYFYLCFPTAGAGQSYVYPARGLALQGEGAFVHDVRLGQYGRVVLLHHLLQGEVLVEDGVSQVLEVFGMVSLYDFTLKRVANPK